MTFVARTGIGIYSEYKYGSARSARERLTLPDLQFLGVSLADVQALGVLPRVRLPLKALDRRRIKNLLSSEVGRNDPIIARELRSMQQFNCKAEIEALRAVSRDYLTTTYVMDKRQQLMNEALMGERNIAEPVPKQEATAASFEAVSSSSSASFSAMESRDDFPEAEDVSDDAWLMDSYNEDSTMSSPPPTQHLEAASEWADYM